MMVEKAFWLLDLFGNSLINSAIIKHPNFVAEKLEVQYSQSSEDNSSRTSIPVS